MMKAAPVKWVGGKTKLLPTLLPLLNQHKSIVEPFVGSGVVFNNTGFTSGLLGDSNRDIILVHQFLRDFTDAFILDTLALFTPENNNEGTFYKFRAEFNSTLDDWRKATLFLWLNRHCFNGLCRYNKQGGFNVSFGKYRAPMLSGSVCKAWGERLKGIEVIWQPFEATIASAPAEAVIYADPPYSPLSATSNFSSYTQDGFTHEDHINLRDRILEAPNHGIISNHDTPLTRELYKDFDIIALNVQRNISCVGDKRLPAPELLAIKRK